MNSHTKQLTIPKNHVIIIMLDIKRWDYMIKKIFLGFTLAELIVAMAIVGSVAAITLPPLITNHQNKVMQISLQKAYRDLENNLEELQANDYKKGFYHSKLASTEGVADFLAKYYNRDRDCGNETQPCFAATYASIYAPSTDVEFSCEDGISAQLKDSTAICIIPATPAQEAKEANPDTGEEAQEAKDAVPATVYIDVNANEPPNIGGRDMFKFQIANFSIVDNSAETSCTTSTVGAGCLNHIINDNWKVRY